MKIFNYKLKDFEEKYNVPVGFFNNEDVVIDNEIQNDISSDWNYLKGKLSVVGFLHKDMITIIATESEYDEDFKQTVKEKLDFYSSFSNLYAFNNKMEMGNFKGFMDFDISIKEIKPFNSKGWNKDKFFKLLRERKQIPDFEIIDIFKGNAGLCIDRWEKFVETKDFQNIMDVVSHNINCLLKESVILNNQKFFKDNWEVDDRNWMMFEKKTK